MSEVEPNAQTRSDDRYRMLAETMLQGVVHQDATGRVIAMNPAAERILGRTQDQLAAAIANHAERDTIREDGSPFPRSEHPSRIAMQTGQAVHGVVMGILNPVDGDYRWIRVDAMPIFREGSDRPVEVYAVLEDITQRRRTQKALDESRKQNEFLANLFHTSSQPTAIGYPDGRLGLVNRAFEELTGYTSEELKLIGWADALTPPEWREFERTKLAEQSSTGQPVRYEKEYLRKDGSRVPIELLVHMVPGEDGKPQYYYSFLTDITERKQQENRQKELVALADARAAELAAAKTAAEAANHAKDHFLAVLSHELRTPLTPVLATSMILETDRRLASDQLEMIQMIRRNVELEARLIDDLLDITRISRNKLELKISVIDVHRKIINVLGICAEDAANKHHVIQTDLNATHHRIDGDPARFQQIIWNLLKNAIKFTPDSGKIRIATSNPTTGRLAIVVSDTGIGIEAEAFPRIFDAFEQGGREVTRRFGGLGLGLAISKALVDMHAGTITAQSAGKDQGAVFTIEFPTSSNTSSSQPLIPGKTASAISCRILLVEDHADTRRVMTSLLTKLGCQVKPASTVAEALALAKQHTFDLLVSDIGLPDAAGTDLMREVKSRYGLRGIALSGYGMDEDLARSKEAGFSMHLTKPVNIQELQDAIRKLTEH